MPLITFIQPDGSGVDINAKENYSLMEIALEHNIQGIDGACGGVIACGTCHCHIDPKWSERVKAEDNDLSEEEIDMLDVVINRTDTSRLGCQIKVTNKLNGLIVIVPPNSTN